MLLLIVLILITIISFIIVKLDDKFWQTEALFCVGGLLGMFGFTAVFIACAILITNLCVAPSAQANYEERYNKILYKVDHIDSYNFEDIRQEVDDWNETYRTNTYGKESSWVGVFYTIDTSTTNLIELKGDIK